MHKKLPIAQTFFFAFTLFLSATNLALANYSEQTTTKETVKKHQKSVLKKTIQPTQSAPKVTDTPMPSRDVSSRPIPSIGINYSPTPTLKIEVSPPQAITPEPTHTSIPTLAPSSTTDNIAYIMNEINKYRQSQGLSPVQTSSETCAFAAMRAQEISSNFSHDGFNTRISSKTLPYAIWSGVTENIAMTPNYQNVVNLWANSPGHAANMKANTPFVCVQQNGNYYAYEGMKP